MDFIWWYQNTTQLMDTDPKLSIQSMTVKISNGFLDTTSTLTIPSVDRADAGNYTCVASNTVFGNSMQDVQQFMLCKYDLVAMHVVHITVSRDVISPMRESSWDKLNSLPCVRHAFLCFTHTHSTR